MKWVPFDVNDPGRGGYFVPEASDYQDPRADQNHQPNHDLPKPDSSESQTPPQDYEHPDVVTVDSTYTISYEPSARPDKPASPSADDGHTPSNAKVRIGFESLASAEKTLLTAAEDLAASYDKLRKTVTSTQDTVFGQGKTSHVSRLKDPTVPQLGYVSEDVADPLASEGEKFAKEIKPYMHRALEDFALVVRGFGAYVKALEAAGDGYASADNASLFDSGS